MAKNAEGKRDAFMMQNNFVGVESNQFSRIRERDTYLTLFISFITAAFAVLHIVLSKEYAWRRVVLGWRIAYLGRIISGKRITGVSMDCLPTGELVSLVGHFTPLASSLGACILYDKIELGTIMRYSVL